MNLDNLEIYTVTIVRNVGVPISFTVRRWKLVFVLVICLLLSCILLYGSLSYLVLRLETQQLSRNLVGTQKKLDLLNLQVAKKNQERYWQGFEKRGADQAAIKANLLKQSEFTTEGMWVTNKIELSLDQIQSGAAVEISKFSAQVNGDDLNLRVRLRNVSTPAQAVGGYLVITLVNQDQTPPLYQAATDGPLGEKGFPSNFKSGRQYYLKSKNGLRNIRHKFQLSDAAEYYTDATLFIFSYKGSLLTRKTIRLDKKIFLE